jgi:hypothetical protein
VSDADLALAAAHIFFELDLREGRREISTRLAGGSSRESLDQYVKSRGP